VLKTFTIPIEMLYDRALAQRCGNKLVELLNGMFSHPREHVLKPGERINLDQFAGSNKAVQDSHCSTGSIRFQDYPAMAWDRNGGDKDRRKFVHHYRESGTSRKGDRWRYAIRERKEKVKAGLVQMIRARRTMAFEFFEKQLRPIGIHDQLVGVFGRPSTCGARFGSGLGIFWGTRRCRWISCNPPLKLKTSSANCVMRTASSTVTSTCLAYHDTI
jgi:hypothetical protein